MRLPAGSPRRSLYVVEPTIAATEKAGLGTGHEPVKFRVVNQTHKNAVETGYADLAILETYKYWDSAGRAVVAAIGGKDPQQALDDLAAEWNGLTEQIGVDRQREAYTAWAAAPAAYRE